MQGATIVQNVRITGNSLGDVDLAANATLNDTRAWYTGNGAAGKWESMTSCAPQFRYDLEAYLATHNSHYKSLQVRCNSMICKIDDTDHLFSINFCTCDASDHATGQCNADEEKVLVSVACVDKT